MSCDKHSNPSCDKRDPTQYPFQPQRLKRPQFQCELLHFDLVESASRPKKRWKPSQYDLDAAQHQPVVSEALVAARGNDTQPDMISLNVQSSPARYPVVSHEPLYQLDDVRISSSDSTMSNCTTQFWYESMSPPETPRESTEAFAGISNDSRSRLEFTTGNGEIVVYATSDVEQDHNIGAHVSDGGALAAKLPFIDNAKEYVPCLPKEKKLVHGSINGYIKFRLRDADDEAAPRSPWDTGDNGPLRTPIFPRQPEDFGLGIKLGKVDRKFYSFYIKAWCPGRSILPDTNTWLMDLGPMLPSDELLRHALLALGGVYILDYRPEEELRRLVNQHYQDAVRLLTRAIKTAKTLTPGQGDALVAAIAALNMSDVVQWEARRPKDMIPRWLEGARVATWILDKTDPGSRYYDSKNIQVGKARISNTIIIGRAAILPLTTLPLAIQHTEKNQFSWLAHGTERESRMIHGACGFCPKLLHVFAQITHCAAKLEEDPNSIIYLPVAAELGKVLHSMVQWSQYSPGYDSPEALLKSCSTDINGVVSDHRAMTHLTAEAWRVTAQIYLQCRVFRLPRDHPIVRRHTELLAKLIDRTPRQGELFTAQAPFMPVFFLGMIAHIDKHRQVANEWFKTVLSAAHCRSSVEPAWIALQRLQRSILGCKDDLDQISTNPGLPLLPIPSIVSSSLSGRLTTVRAPVLATGTLHTGHARLSDHVGDDPSQCDLFSVTCERKDWQTFDALPLSDRTPWWEDLVQRIYAEEGTLCLI